MLGNVLDTNARLIEAGMDADFYVRRTHPVSPALSGE
tara:strand:+ start:2989 stop:3099 length:111 start_codon:yes stop_codon:yes gene_type:complete